MSKKTKKNWENNMILKQKIQDEDDQLAAESIYTLRIELMDILALLDSCNAGGFAGRAKNILGEGISRKCLMAAESLIIRSLKNLNTSGI